MSSVAAVPALISFLLFAMIGFGLGRKRPFIVLSVLLIGLLFHELLVKWLTYLFGMPGDWVQAISLWKDGVLLGLLAAVVLLRARQAAPFGLKRWRQNLGPVEISLAATVAVGLVSWALAPDRLAGFAAFRDYYQPLLLFGLALWIPSSKRQLRNLVDAWLSVGGLMALIGLWQTFGWSEADYLRFGFGQAISDLGVPPLDLGGRVILRAPSIVSGPNELGMHMVLLLLFVCCRLILPGGTRQRRLILSSCVLLFAVALAYSYSRGDVVALPLGMLMLLAAVRRKGASFRLARIWPLILAVLITLVVSYTNGTIGTLVDTATGLSQDYHIVDTTEAVRALLRNPQGVGMGQVGPRRGAFFPDQPRFHVEGSFFQIAFDMGVWGLLVWIAALVVVLQRAWRALLDIRDPMVDSLAKVAVSGWVALVPVLLFIPILQSLTMMSWMWFLLGVAMKGPEIERTS